MKIGAMRKYVLVAMAAAAFGIGSAASAATMVLDSSTQCSAGNAINGIAVGDVTGNAGGASECWGTFDGTDPGPSGDGFQIGSIVYDFVAKNDIENGVLSGADIGLATSTGTSGTWEFDATKWGAGNYGDFIIVLKASNSPGYASWLFEGSDAASTSGDWKIAWTTGNNSTPDLSHISVYATPAPVPVPAAGILLITALGGLGVAARRRRKSS